MKTIKNIFNSFSTNPLFILFGLSFAICGYFKSFIIIISIIIIHEIGHFIAGTFFKWELDKIYLYPYGGYTKFNTKMNVLLREELIVLLMGPIFQIVFTIIMINNRELVTYSSWMLIFNLLPIYPLDGGKLLNIILCYKYPYLKSYQIVTIISIISLIIFTYISIKYFYNASIIMMGIFLSTKIFEYIKTKKHSFNRFLLERHLYNYEFNKYKSINSIKEIYRDKKHVINNKTEKSYLRNYFNSISN